MKKIITLVSVLLTTMVVNSQSLNHLDSVSASNLYVSTNKKQVLTKYETNPEQTFIFYYGNGNVANLTNYDFIVFNNENELLGFLNMVERSIVKRKMIIHHMEKDNIRLKGVTDHTAELNIKKYEFYLNDESIKDIRNQLLNTK